MRASLYIILSVLVLSAASCSRKVVTQQSHTALHQDSSHTAIDTSKTTTAETQKQTTNFGDTVKAKIFVPINCPLKVDSVTDKKEPFKPFPIFIESNGILILGKITQSANGNGFDLDLKAIAKPQSFTNETTKTTTENKGINTTDNNKKDLTQSSKYKATDKQDEIMKWVGLTMLGLAVMLLIGLIIFLYKKNKNGKGNF